jgi:NADPH:quinone reductase-like Zn-dependent oxidoreductase
MRALELRAYEGVPALRAVDKSVPSPRAGEVVVRVAAAPVNPSDLMFVRGRYGIKKELPTVPGFEGSGVVVAAGAGVGPRALLGRRVACLAQDEGDGTWAEYMCTPASRCIPLLPRVDLEAAASLVVNPMTAHALVGLAAGARAAAQTAAASALGRMIVRLAQRRRLPMVHVVRRAAQVELLRGIGAEHVVDSSEPDFELRLKEICRQLGVTVAFDAVAGETTGQLLRAMPRRSRVIVYGALSEATCQVDPGMLIFGEKSVEGFWLSKWMTRPPHWPVLRAGIDVQRKLSTDFSTEVRARVSLDEAPSAIADYAESMTAGKVLIVPQRARV